MSAGALALPFAANALIQRLRLRRVLPVMRRAFQVLDPLLNAHLASYSGSDVRLAAELITAALSDGQLTRDEASFAAAEMLRRWSPQLAAGQKPAQLPPESTESRVLGAVESLVGRGAYSLNSLPEAITTIRRSLIP